jgi:adenylate cyclase
LFCDLRGYTAISERLTPRQSYALLGDVMDRFTQDIMDADGVILDYFGDGLAAFWNAPLPQADHALRACRAALAMCGSLPEISADWHMVTDCPLRMGIGIHTGTALVGNAGSQARIKYGPRGSAVNLASRVQSATRQLGVPILLTKATAAQLSGKLPTRSLSRQTLPGFAEPVELCELLSSEPIATSPSLIAAATRAKTW